MNRILALVLICSALAGCTDPESAAEPEVAPAAPVIKNTTAALVLTIDQSEVVLQGTDIAVLTGTATPGALVSVTYKKDLGDSVTAHNGTWSMTFPVAFGHTGVLVLADDGTTSVARNVTIKRNMELTVAINHDPAQGKQDRSDTIYWDNGGLRSLHEDASYEGCAQPHPERPNAHDALLDYMDATGVHMDFSDCGSFGVSPSNVERVDYGPLGWCFNVNGAQADFGISLLELEDGDVFEFVNCSGFA